MRSISVTLTLGLLPASFTLAPGQGPQTLDRPALEKLLVEVRRKHDVPALAAGVVRDDGLQLAAITGVRRRGSQAAALLSDRFHLGSNTKPITAYLLALLIEAGLLDWDTPLERIFPELAQSMDPDFKKVTPEQLTSHTAGVSPNFPGGWHQAPAADTPRRQRALVLEHIVAREPSYRPGSKYVYSNLGYTLAGAICERVAKKSWEQLLEEKVFTPLKMKQVGHGVMGSPGPILEPWQHRADGTPIEPVPEADNPPVMGPAGRLHANVADYAAFLADTLRCARGGKTLFTKAESAARLFIKPLPEGHIRGGWVGSKAELGHDGSNTQNYASAQILPERNLALFVFTNQGGKAGQDACHETLKLLRQRIP